MSIIDLASFQHKTARKKFNTKDNTDKRRKYLYAEPLYFPLKDLREFKEKLWAEYHDKIPKTPLAWFLIERFIDDLPKDNDKNGNGRIWLNASTWHSREKIAARSKTTADNIKKIERSLVRSGLFIRRGGYHGQTRHIAFSPDLISLLTGLSTKPKPISKKKGVLPVSPIGGTARDPYIGGTARDPYRISSKVKEKRSSKANRTTTTTFKLTHVLNDMEVKRYLMFPKKRLIDIYNDEIVKNKPQRKERSVDESVIKEELKALRKPENEFMSFLEHVRRSEPDQKSHQQIYNGITGIVGEGFKESLLYFKKMASHKGYDYVRCYLDVLRIGSKELARRNGVKMHTFSFDEICSFQIHKDVHAEVSKILKNEKP